MYLNVLLIQSKQDSGQLSDYNSSTNTPKEIPVVCDGDCIENIYKTIEESTTSGQKSRVVKEVTKPSIAKEYYISLGSGVNTSDDWTDIPAAQIYIDSSKYENIVTATFEVSMYIPNGNQIAFARLYNVSDNHPVWNSEVSLSGGTAKLLISSPITLDLGNKLYQVQMKSQLKGPINLVDAKVHIVTK